MYPVSKRIKIEAHIQTQDYSAALPIEILKFVLSFLDMTSLRAAEQVCKKWKAHALDCWKKVAIEEIGPVAVTLFQHQGCWRKVALFCFQRFYRSTNLLSNLTDEKKILPKENSTVFLETISVIVFHSDIHDSKIEEVKEINPDTFHMRNPMTGRTALEEAAVNGNIKIAQLLIDKGAKEVKAFDQNINSTALFLAAAHCHPEMVQLLLKNGASVEIGLMANNKSFISNIVDMYLYIKKEKRKEYFECLVLLLRAWITQKGSNYVINHKDAKAALKDAISSNFLEIAELFMAYGIIPNLCVKEKEN